MIQDLHTDTERESTLTFCVDSGCTDHLVNNKNYFDNLLMLKKPIKIAVAKNGNYMEAVGVGNIKVLSKLANEKIKCYIRNVLYVPNLRKNLLSVKKLESSNITVIFENNKVKLLDKNRKIIAIGKRNNLYELNFEVIKRESLNIEKESDDAKLWYKRLGHLGYSNLEKLIKHKMVNGLNENIEINKIKFCEACVNGKMTRLPFRQRTRAKRILEIIHSDVCGPISPTSYDDNKYFVTF